MYSFLLNWGPWIFNRIIYGSDQGIRLITNVYREVTVIKEYYFIKGFLFPLHSSMFPMSPFLQTKLKWKATLGPARFVSNEPTATTLFKNISYLGFTVDVPTVGHLDLSDWISEVKYVSVSTKPTPLELFVLWCIDTGNPYFLHIDETTSVQLIDEMGELVLQPLMNGRHSGPNADSTSLEQNGSQTLRFDTDRSLDTLFSPSGC
jgi:hypothetical protein